MKSGDWPLEPWLVIGQFRQFFREIHQSTNRHAELQWPVTTFREPIFLQDWPPLGQIRLRRAGIQIFLLIWDPGQESGSR